jgi:hypothetical protein
MKIKEYNDMKAYLLKPNRLFTSKPQDTIGGGAIQGEDLGSRMGFAKPIPANTFKEEYETFKKISDISVSDKAFAEYLNEKGYITSQNNPFTDKTVEKRRRDLNIEGRGTNTPPSVEKKRLQINEYLSEIIPKLNAENKFYLEKDVFDMIKKKFGEDVKIDKRYYPVMNQLYSGSEKIDDVLVKMLSEDEAVGSTWLQSLSDRTGIAKRTLTEKLKDSQIYSSIKDQGADLLKDRYSRPEYFDFLNKLSFGDQLKYALEHEKGMPVFIGQGGEKFYSNSPRNTVMNFARRNWNLNRGNGAIKFYNKKTGKEIPWEFGTKLPYTDVSFSYNGKKYDASSLKDLSLVKKEFPEVYETQTAVNNLRNRQIDDPLNKGKKISLGELVSRNQIEIYGWNPRTPLFDIMHGVEGVANDPFTNLSFNTKDINVAQNAIMQSSKIPQDQKKLIFNQIDEIISNAPENIIARQQTISKTGAGINFENFLLDIEKYGSNKSKLNTYLKTTFCNYKSEGGRIGFANGPCTPDTVVDGMKKAIQQGDSAKVLKALNVGKNLLGYAIAPADIAIETAFALPYLLEGDLEGAKAATTAGLFGWGKDLQEQVGDRFGTNSPAYGSLEKQRAINLQVEGMFEMDKALAYGEKSGVFTKDKDGNYTKNPNLSVSQIDSFKNANNIFKSGAEKTMEAKILFIDALPKIEGLENESTATSQLGVFSDELRSGVLDQKIGDPGIIANLTKSLNVSQPADTSKVKPFIETMGGETKFPIPSRVAEGSDLIKERIDQLREMRIGDYPPDVALGIPSYEKEQAYEGIRPYALKYGPKAAKEFFEAQGIDTEPYLKGMAPILYMKQGGRIQLANGGRLSFAEGPEDPKKRTTLKKIGIGGGIAGGLATGLINILDLFKGGAKTGVMATKAAQSQAEKLFFDLVNAVKNKGILKKLDQMTDFSRGGAYYEYKGVKVLEDGENIELQFTTDKGAPAVVEYRKPGYDVDPEAGTSYKVPGEFTNEGQEIARYGKDGDVDIDFENEIIDPIENVKKIIDD